MKLNSKQEKLILNVVLDGIIVDKNIEILKKNRDWVKRQIRKQGITDIRKIFLETCDKENNVSVYMKVNNQNADDMF